MTALSRTALAALTGACLVAPAGVSLAQAIRPG